jgi:hypothetical protein
LRRKTKTTETAIGAAAKQARKQANKQANNLHVTRCCEGGETKTGTKNKGGPKQGSKQGGKQQ